ncbi:peptidoglycan DD-metalloendopeptidase family protein [Maricaulis sp.]|uniref:M23 family metallopeptidase n=1 Tax=Maricaulis sp. TaxID=1486257 RepID=UPI002628C12B|nr:peptidoglycan DD-metalloendopeptidase family protein [Maricaulis sp.]
MSGFDVTRADKHRARGVVAFASLSLSTALLFALLSTQNSSSEAASLDTSEPIIATAALAASEAATASGTELESALTAEAAPSEPVLERSTAPAASALYNQHFVYAAVADAAALDAAAFRDCSSCATIIQVERRVPRGGTLAGVLEDAGIGNVEAARAIAALGNVFNLRQLRAGQSINLYLETRPEESRDVALNGLSFRPDVDRAITVARTFGDEFRARETIAEFEVEMARASGTISQSLYVDALDAGATDRVVVELAGVLAYAIDFQRSIRAGDEFDILFERHIDDEGNTARTGDILYARYAGRGEPKEFFRYETEDGIIGYYSGDGASAQRLLMLTPINGARLSSHFGRRRHPILGYTRNHNGTDFAAPTGTPIFAAGNGVVLRANRFGSFGNYIRLRHANGYETAYAHLNGFARGIRSGTRVTQGQVIGYVGTTGRSTGPHLHYEVHHNGRPVNPMTLDLPTGRQLNADEIPLFEAERDRILAIRDGAVDARSGEAPIMADASNGGAQ